jgi:ADP-dependent NAD(P)H-hydrate dehydratase / NAD(P)H-hydrate epimerase
MSSHSEKRPTPEYRIVRDKLALEALAIQHGDVAAMSLMGKAGEHLAKAVVEACRDIDTPRISIVCGPGNNGGDGYACAVALLQGNTGLSPHAQIIIAECRPDASKPRSTESEHYYQQLQNHADPRLCLLDVSPGTVGHLKAHLRASHVIVDALYGVGLNRPIEEQGLSAECIAFINLAHSHDKAWVLSADIPSGLDSQTGQVRGAGVWADETIVFTATQPGHWLEAGRDRCGRKSVVDLGIPRSYLERLFERVDDDVDNNTPPLFSVNTAFARRLLPKRPSKSHKGDFGHVLIIAGSRAMPGAASLASIAALRSGAGRVTLAAPESVFTHHYFASEIMRLPLAETNNGQLSASALDLLQVNLSRFNAIALGPGLGLSSHTQAVFESLLSVLLPQETPLILDADALNLWSQSQEPLGPNVLITPHAAEAARMLGLSTETVLCDLYQAGLTLQTKTQANILLKSSTSVLIPHPQHSTLQFLSSAGNSGMATAGSGDVLTGLLAGLLAQGLRLPNAMALGVHLHGLSGDIAAATHTPYCMTASDLIESLPQAFKSVMTHESAH